MQAIDVMAEPVVVVRVVCSDRRAFTRPLRPGRTVIGRAEAADIRIDDLGVSGEHLALVLDQRTLRVDDLGSLNGTRVNGERVGSSALRDGDELALGDARIVVSFATAAVTQPIPRLRSLDAAAPSAPATPPNAGREDRAARALADVGRLLELGVPPAETYQRIADLALRAFTPDRVGVFSIRPSGPPELVASRSLDGSIVVLDAATIGRVLAGGAPIYARLAAPDGERSVLCAPLRKPRRRDAIDGLLYLETTSEVSPRLLDLLVILASCGAAALENTRVVREGRPRETLEIARPAAAAPGLDALIGESEPMRRLRQLVEVVRDSDSTVLVTGESGTGKELVARALHHRPLRTAAAPFVAINCAAIPEHLLESELFGIEKGVATGVDARAGKFEAARGGTLFLDEIGELPLGFQAKLLRVLETREVERVGGRGTIRVEARVVAATNRDLASEVAAKRFREDLFYRLNVVPVTCPPLRDRRDDVQALAESYLARAAQAASKSVPMLSADALAALRAYSWPGNIRELVNEVERLVAVRDPGETGEIAVAELSDRIRAPGRRKPSQAPPEPGPAPGPIGNLKDVIAQLTDRAELDLIRRALAATGNNRVRAAELLGLSREGLRLKMLRHKLA